MQNTNLDLIGLLKEFVDQKILCTNQLQTRVKRELDFIEAECIESALTSGFISDVDSDEVADVTVMTEAVATYARLALTLANCRKVEAQYVDLWLYLDGDLSAFDLDVAEDCSKLEFAVEAMICAHPFKALNEFTISEIIEQVKIQMIKAEAETDE